MDEHPVSFGNTIGGALFLVLCGLAMLTVAGGFAQWLTS